MAVACLTQESAPAPDGCGSRTASALARPQRARMHRFERSSLTGTGRDDGGESDRIFETRLAKQTEGT